MGRVFSLLSPAQPLNLNHRERSQELWKTKVRIINHVNYTEYADVEVKDETELDEMYTNGIGIYDNAEWIHGKDYGETYYEILDEEVQGEEISG